MEAKAPFLAKYNDVINVKIAAITPHVGYISKNEVVAAYRSSSVVSSELEAYVI